MPDSLTRRSVALIACVLLSLAAPERGTTQSLASRTTPDPRDIAVDVGKIDDEFFALVAGMMRTDATASYGRDALLYAFRDYRDMPPDTPVKKLAEVTRTRIGRTEALPFADEHRPPGAAVERSRTAAIRVAFTEPIVHPMPVDFLGYHPGAIETTPTIRLVEHAYPARYIPAEDGDDVVLAPLYALKIVDGRLFMNFRPLVDRLLFGVFDDLDAKVVLLFRFEESWYAMLLGEGHRQRTYAWTFNLETTEFMRRPPRQLESVPEQFLSGASGG